jgi:hypothetical protein
MMFRVVVLSLFADIWCNKHSLCGNAVARNCGFPSFENAARFSEFWCRVVLCTGRDVTAPSTSFKCERLGAVLLQLASFFLPAS